MMGLTLGDRDVLEEEDDGRDGDEGTKSSDEIGVDVRGSSHVLETARDVLEDRDVVVGDRRTAEVDPGEDGEHDDGERRTERVDEEGDALHEGVARTGLDAREDESHAVEEDESRDTVRSVALRRSEVLERVDDHLVRRCSGAANEGASVVAREREGTTIGLTRTWTRIREDWASDQRRWRWRIPS